MKKALAASVSHTEETIKELRADRQFEATLSAQSVAIHLIVSSANSTMARS